MDIMELIRQFLLEQALILVPVLLFLGFALKKIPKMPNWLIPWVLLAAGIAGGVALVSMDVSGVIQGILAASMAVFGHQLYKQTKEHDTDAGSTEGTE